MKYFFARAIPYILTFFAGAGVFWLSYARPSVWSDWLVEISGALSAIPIVFLIYDYFNYRITAHANQKQADDLSNKINDVIVVMLEFFYIKMGGRGKPGIRALQKLVDSSATTINKNLNLGKKIFPLCMNTKTDWTHWYIVRVRQMFLMAHDLIWQLKCYAICRM